MPTLSSETNNTFLEPARIVEYFGLAKGDHVADFGAGHGYFTIPMARLVGGNGKIYAIDIQKSVLSIIRSKAKTENLLNIELIWTDLDHPENLKIKDSFLEFVLIANALFQSENKEGVFRAASRVLRPNGRMAVIEWDDTASPPLGPPIALRINKDKVKSLAIQAGLKLDREFSAGSHHYGLLFKK